MKEYNKNPGPYREHSLVFKDDMRTWLNRVLEDFVYSLNFFIFRSVQDDDNRSDDTQAAPYSPYRAELFIEEP